TGSKKIASSLIEKTDVFFGATGNFKFIPYNAGWNYTIVNGDGDNDWDPSETLHISINSTTPKGEYYVGIVLYNSIAVSDYFST
ncbi:MAG: hypothetical protein KKD69_02150, partial [Euryarchaeota archaeon]|nr:hypothetical protein [Euryarchaeota archaeon]